VFFEMFSIAEGGQSTGSSSRVTGAPPVPARRGSAYPLTAEISLRCSEIRVRAISRLMHRTKIAET
jgi:hypothetical protein